MSTTGETRLANQVVDRIAAPRVFSECGSPRAALGHHRRWAMKIRRLLPFVGAILSSGCSDPEYWDAQRVLEEAFYTLLSNQPISEELTSAQLTFADASYTWSTGTSEGRALTNLQARLCSASISDWDPLVRGKGLQRRRVATLSLRSARAERDYPVFEALDDPRHFLIRNNIIGDGGSILSFYNPYGIRYLIDNIQTNAAQPPRPAEPSSASASEGR